MFSLKDTPLKKCYSLTERPGYLRLYGNCYDLNSPESPSMLLRKQSSYSDSFSVKMSFDPTRVGYESGVTMWWHHYSYASMGIAAVEHPTSGEVIQTVVVREPTGKNGDIRVSRNTQHMGLSLLLKGCSLGYIPTPGRAIDTTHSRTGGAHY
jgi:beta-xylosidase